MPSLSRYFPIIFALAPAPPWCHQRIPRHWYWNHACLWWVSLPPLLVIWFCALSLYTFWRWFPRSISCHQYRSIRFPTQPSWPWPVSSSQILVSPWAVSSSPLPSWMSAGSQGVTKCSLRQSFASRQRRIGPCRPRWSVAPAKPVDALSANFAHLTYDIELIGYFANKMLLDFLIGSEWIIAFATAV